ncbi:sulfurtransferase complex subunit TusD [Biformimicrobium ophioploci]|uniref:Sulfurtransferase complex subunit TusD n=1 Tax=Biformimicrobium ophioploci TaxID=3036711 RepID=A0ABQ6M1S4_9GAMM|nr:sulfurtransferase complex subunit TusD [Microbulbifer sp. NKW57]GMG88304.1 sulfurtransferase complex subunit TusD [Microbulbifer sp. NKW57]
MIFSLAIYGAPYSSQAAYSALRFAEAVIRQGHSIHRLFFYTDGVHCGTALACPPQDELNLQQSWQQLIERHKLDAVVCIAAGQKRGVISEGEAKRFGKPAFNLAPGFELAGLGQLADAVAHSDRVITFGG